MGNKLVLVFEANHIQKAVILVLTLLIFIVSVLPSAHGFSVGFYTLTCPAAELIVRDTVRSATASDSNVPGKLLHLLFHDCFVQVSFCFYLPITIFHHSCSCI